MTKPIEHYDAVKVVPLETAVEPLVSLVPDIKEMVFKAKQKCDQPKDGLTIDESASIMLYSLEWEPREKSLYVMLNSTLRAEDREKIKPWELYIKLFVSSLEKLPSISRTIYRGVKMDLSAQYPQGKTFVWYAFSSCTNSVQVLQSEQFLGKTGTRTLFNIDCESGKNIQNHSFFPNEDEILLIAARKLQVVSCLDSGNGLTIIQLKEVGADDPLLGSARTDSTSSEASTASKPSHEEDSATPDLISLNPQNLIPLKDPKLSNLSGFLF
ncbi:unnamed protein product [Rotaria sp. Silwood1]|nr:unnamed protein product [Rotaria sp. Silwood1]CAF1618780.1 unnamed protein product [Rotaria sp. Silwood1]CAF3776909.1 unnamed protein product [Rotaria sp. Silwood1]CAF4946266.1 unnamed protein product [Rotaria sp. Silwood1]